MPQFMMLSLYYLYCKFKSANPVYGPPGSTNQVPELIFRDNGRKLQSLNRDLNAEVASSVEADQQNGTSSMVINSSSENADNHSATNQDING